MSSTPTARLDASLSSGRFSRHAASVFSQLISDALPFGRLCYGQPNAISNAIGYAQFYSRSHDAVIRVYDAAGNLIETHAHAGDFKEWCAVQDLSLFGNDHRDEIIPNAPRPAEARHCPAPF